MPHVAFEELSPDARVWVFGAGSPLQDDARREVLRSVDEHLSQWRAHGVPLVCSREFLENRFLAIGVDEAATGASGCSIDGLFRILQQLQTQLAVPLIGGGAVFYRDADGTVQCTDRSGFSALVKEGVVNEQTHVFDLTIATVRDWHERFERRAEESWHARMVHAARG